MLFARDPHDGLVPRVVLLAALMGVIRGFTHRLHGKLTDLFAVERYTGHAPGSSYAELGFRPPSDAGPTLRPLAPRPS